MAATAYRAHGLKDFKGGIELKAAALVAADTAETGVYLGKGLYMIRVVVSTIEIVDNDELYNITLESNTVAAASTWKKLPGQILLGALEINGGDGDSGATHDFVFAVYNPADDQVRVNTLVDGTIATGCNFSVTAYPVNQFAY